MKYRTSARPLLLMLACVALAACTSKADRIQSGLKRGGEYASQGDWDKASVEARNVLQVDPKNARAFLIAGQVADGKGAFRAAYSNYSKALEIEPDLLEAKIPLVRIYLLANEIDRATATVDEVLAKRPQDVRARVLKVALLARSGREVRGLADADAIVASGDELPAESSLQLAGLYVNSKLPDKALTVLDKAIAANPRNVDLLQMAAEVAGSPGQDAAMTTRVDGYFDAATRLAPTRIDLWKEWALVHVRRNQLTEAESILRNSVRADPKDSARTLALLDFSAAFRGGPATEKEFQAAIEARPKDTSIRFAFAKFYRGAKRVDDARRVLLGIVANGKDTPDGLAARDQLAAMDVGAGKKDLARADLAEILKVNPRDASALVLRGQISLSEGNPRDAVTDLRAAAKDSPGSAEIAALLAQAHRASGDPQLAREVLIEASKFKPEDSQLHLLLAADMAAEHEFKAAAHEAEEARRLDPKSIYAHELVGEYALERGDLDVAEKTAQELQIESSNDPSGFMLMGRVMASRQKPAAALAQYDAAARLAPESALAPLAAMSMLVTQRRFDEANTRIEALVSRQPKLPIAYQMRAELALAKGDLPRAEQSYRDALHAAPPTPQAYKNLSSVMVSRGNLVGALTVMDEGEQAFPQDTLLPAARGLWLARAGRTEDAIAVYEKMLKQTPPPDEAANNLAYILTQVKGDKASLDRASQLVARFESTNNPVYAGTLGLVRYRLGQYDRAVSALDRAVSLAPNEPILQLHYGMALFKAGDTERARRFLRKAFDSKVQMPNLAEAHAMVARG